MRDRAKKIGYVPIFITGTLPPEYHLNPVSSAKLKGKKKRKEKERERDVSLSPSAAAKELGKRWHRAMCLMREHEIRPYGVRVLEPYEDGCPHLHVILWCAPDHRSAIERILRIQFPADGGSEDPKTQGWYRRQNALGLDVYIRPGTEGLPDGHVHGLAFVDDLDRDTVEVMRRDGLPFSVLVESSPARFHGWLRVSQTPLPRAELTAVCKAIADKHGTDKGSADWRHFGRAVGFTNRKPSRAVPGKGQPFTRLAETSAPVAPGAAAVVAHARAYLAAESARRAVISKAVDHHDIKRTAGKLRSAADIAHAARLKNSNADESAKDFSAMLALVAAGYSDDEVRAALLTVSSDLLKRHPEVSKGGNDYVTRSRQRARELAEQREQDRDPTKPGYKPIALGSLSGSVKRK